MKVVVPFHSFIIFLLLSPAMVAFAQNYYDHLHFYFLECVVGSPNATVVVSVNLHLESSAGGFDNIGVIDNILLQGPQPSSPVIGRAQGLVVYSDLTGLSVTMALNFVHRRGAQRELVGHACSGGTSWEECRTGASVEADSSGLKDGHMATHPLYVGCPLRCTRITFE
ncbi:hypothetical protein ZIOFF_041264 [Zingiber officinale]|uniref:Dirigent protein n=1 Tax=Zingiber officinale TaxID=94328 RepID=A0A8J5L5G7_ZINOF|nr:hypothetical protein ZIOFF_041264 [Zingiber officinale]